MNKSINPALARIQAIKNKAGRGSSFETIEPFINSIVGQEPIDMSIPLEEIQDAELAAQRAFEEQIAGIGVPAPTNTHQYNNTEGTMDKLEEELKKMLPKSET